MARYRGPVGKVSRRLGIGISEKGQRILNKRAFPPGQHGPSARRRQISEYGLQLQEKQKARYMYGVLERQFHRIFEKAQRYPGETGAYLFVLLERRLDNVVYRLGFATSRQQARQLVTHGHITVNGRKTNIPSFTVKPGEKIQYLFEAAVARRPTQNEIGVANQLLVARGIDGQRSKKKEASEDPLAVQSLALQDIFWAVLNSNEFIMNH